MRFMTAILVMVQLLLRGVEVTHCHAQDSRPEPVDHAQRPHVHISGHSHSHANRHQHSPNGMPHRHKDQHDHNDRLGHIDRPGSGESPVTPHADDPLTPTPDHDQDAVYTGCEPLGAPLDRIQAPEPTVADWFLADIQAASAATLVHLIESRAAGPPGPALATSSDVLPHLLRV